MENFYRISFLADFSTQLLTGKFPDTGLGTEVRYSNDRLGKIMGRHPVQAKITCTLSFPNSFQKEIVLRKKTSYYTTGVIELPENTKCLSIYFKIEDNGVHFDSNYADNFQVSLIKESFEKDIFFNEDGVIFKIVERWSNPYDPYYASWVYTQEFDVHERCVCKLSEMQSDVCGLTIVETWFYDNESGLVRTYKVDSQSETLYYDHKRI